MYMNVYPQRQEAREITIHCEPLYGLDHDAENMLISLIHGYASSCAIEVAEDILAMLEDGEALLAVGLTDADQEWVEVLHADIKSAMNNANA